MQKIKANDGTNRGIIHGLCHTPEYTVYVGMKARCHNPKNLRYSDYGGRGIFVCEKWFHNFEAFYLDMGPRPTEKHQLDRIDNNKGYSPDNCQWVEPNINALNKRKYTNNKSGFKGVSFDKRAKFKPWRATIMRNRKQIQVGAFVTAKEANEARQQYIKIIILMTNNLPGFKHLKGIGPFTMSLKDATPETIEKIKDTVRYVMRTYPERDLKQVLRVTTASLLAEQKVAEHMEGQYYSGEENLDEPFTYAFDVLSNIKYQGLRLEVKCSFSGKWINVRDRTRPSHTGINLDSFYMHEVADLLVVFRTIETETNTFYYDLGVICTREMLAPSAGFVHKGQKGTWYMHKNFNDNDAPFFYSKGKI